jgi:hypothetical protein
MVSCGSVGKRDVRQEQQRLPQVGLGRAQKSKMDFNTAISPLLRPSLEEWSQMADTVLAATQMAYAIAYVGEFENLSADFRPEVLAALRDAMHSIWLWLL